MKALILAHLLATLTLFGVIWTIQLVHYPLFGGVGADGFAAYAEQHRIRITWIVLPAMLVELGTAVWFVFDRPAAWPVWATWAGLALVGVIWLSTALLQVPLHSVLARGFDADAHTRLVSTNWIRTVAWSGRAALVLWLTARMI